ncbi:MAG: hypothetical protein Q9162_004631 [Coniocarpon cinnabarinum]
MTHSFTPPQLTLAPLPYPQAQGSAQVAHAGYTVLASANGPVEAVNRSQQQPEETTLEVNVRENAGVGGPRERNMERLIGRTLKPLVDIRAHPRTVVQVTLQLLRTPRDAETSTPIGQAESVVDVLPILINASVAALLNANILMTGVAVAIGVATLPTVDEDGDDGMSDAVVRLTDSADSLRMKEAGAAMHAFAFTGKGELLLANSEGESDLDTWMKAAKIAREVCCGGPKNDGGMVEWLRGQIRNDLIKRRRWQGTSEGD